MPPANENAAPPFQQAAGVWKGDLNTLRKGAYLRSSLLQRQEAEAAGADTPAAFARAKKAAATPGTGAEIPADEEDVEMSYYSVTIGQGAGAKGRRQNGRDVSPAHLVPIAELYDGHAEDLGIWITSLERGSLRNYLHIQSVFCTRRIRTPLLSRKC